MILRKPYAFLIKNFKLIHAIITALIVYLIYKTYSVLSFFGTYISSNPYLISNDDVSNMFGSWTFICPLIIIVLSLILLSVMIFKKKPFVLYISNILIITFLMVMLLICNGVARSLVLSFVDIRTLKLVRDLLMISFILSLYPLMKNFIRTVGFDIKKFDFGKDLEDIKISEADNEEFEVNMAVDTNKVKRNVNSKTRFSKYIYAENKFLINSIIAIVILVIIILIAIGVINTGKNVSMGSSFTTNGFKIAILNSYITRLDNKGNTLNGLSGAKSLVIVKLNINSFNDKGTQFKTANMELQVGNNIYRNVSTYRDKILDLGTTYDGELITKTIEKKLFVFEVPTSMLNENIKIRFVNSIQFKGKDLIPTYINVPLNLINLDDNASSNKVNTNTSIDLSDTILKNSKLNITSIELAHKFKINYSTTLNKNNYEYLLAPLESNYDRDLLKISGSINYDDVGVSSLNNLYNLLDMFGKVEYEINSVKKSVNCSVRVNPLITKSETSVYIAVPSELEQASNVNLVLRIRNNSYVYTIK